MTTILYREITSDGQHTEIIEEFTQLDLKICRSLRTKP